MRLIYKILSRTEWERALADGWFLGSEADAADGYVHFSTAAQVVETARRYFAGQRDLVVFSVDADGLGTSLKWEPSRGGALFPHLYSPLDCSKVIEARRLDTSRA